MSQLSLRKTLCVCAIVAQVAGPVYAADSYRSDQGHTEVMFEWAHAGGVSVQHGEFTSASIELSLDGDAPENSSVTATIQTDSLSSGFAALDKHLKSGDFLAVSTYPTMDFKSTAVKKTSDTTADVTGDLTIHGVTLPVVLKTTLTHLGNHPLGGAMDYYKGDWVAFHATTQIDHQAFGVGGFPTGPITINIHTEMKAP